LICSLAINVFLITVFAYKIYNNWFEQAVLKLPFRESIFKSAPKQAGLIFFVGDSHTEAFELNEYLHNPLVRNRGVWGDISSSVLNRINEISTSKPKKIFLMIGVNDICSGISPVNCFRNISSIIKIVKTVSPETIIYIESVLPTSVSIGKTNKSALPKIVELNKMIKQLNDGKKVKFINLFPSFLNNSALNQIYSFDGMHLNGNGYLKFAQLLSPYVNE
jgi:lysophospholipase L1-like esterase